MSPVVAFIRSQPTWTSLACLLFATHLTIPLLAPSHEHGSPSKGPLNYQLAWVAFNFCLLIPLTVGRIKYLVLLWGLPAAASVCYSLFAPYDLYPGHRQEIAALIALASPILFCAAWAVFCYSAILVYPAFCIVAAIHFLVAAVSFRRLVLRLPRYRSEGAFRDAQLCENCQRLISGSALLTGSWFLLARRCEYHDFYHTVEDIRRAWNGCHLCESLLSEEDEGSEVGSSQQSYGTADRASTTTGPLSLFEREELKVKIEVKGIANRSLGTGLWNFPWYEPYNWNISVRVMGPPDRKFRELVMFEQGSSIKPDNQDTTGADSCLKQISEWIGSCSKHTSCKSLNRLVTDGFFPTRVLDVGTLDNPNLRLVDHNPSIAGENRRYLALSHCWGGNLSSKLDTSNYPHLREHIDEACLPRTFQEAISIARKLEVPYLWIDSLCIIQDSLEDWRRESQTMGHVFANAQCVIAATASRRPDEGCFRLRQDYDRRKLMESGRLACYISRPVPSIKALFETRVEATEAAPLTRRAWAYQERLLAQRMVHFCYDTILFECNSIRASPGFPQGVPYEKEGYWVSRGSMVNWVSRNLVPSLRDISGQEERASRGIRGALNVLQALGPAHRHGSREAMELVRRWYEIVAAYTEGDLTFPTDKLVAIAGIAELVQDSAGSKYLAGLWDTRTLPLALLWAVQNPVKPPPTSTYRAPTWSWASSTGRVALLPDINYDHCTIGVDLVFEAKIHDVTVRYGPETVTGAKDFVDAGHLDLVGRLVPVFHRGGGSPPGLLFSTEPGKRRRHEQQALQFLPDWVYEGNDALYAVLILSVYSDDEMRVYGVVVREKGGCVDPLVFERVGVFAGREGRYEDRLRSLFVGEPEMIRIE